MTRQNLIDFCNSRFHDPNYKKILQDINGILTGNITLTFSSKTFQFYEEIEKEKDLTHTEKLKRYILYHLIEDENFTDQCIDCLIFYLEKKWNLNCFLRV